MEPENRSWGRWMKRVWGRLGCAGVGGAWMKVEVRVWRVVEWWIALRTSGRAVGC